MKKQLQIFIFICFSILSFIHVSFAGTKYVPGYFLSNQGDTIIGQLAIPTQFLNAKPNRKLLQWRALFIYAKKKKQFLLEPETVQGYGFTYKGEKVFYRTVNNDFEWNNPYSENNEKVFMEAEVEGEVDLFKIMRRQEVGGVYVEDGSGGGSSGGAGGSDVYVYFLRRDNILTRLKPMGLKGQLEKYFEDAPLLLAKMDQQKINKKVLPQVVQDYNEWFEKNKPQLRD